MMPETIATPMPEIFLRGGVRNQKGDRDIFDSVAV